MLPLWLEKKIAPALLSMAVIGWFAAGAAGVNLGWDRTHYLYVAEMATGGLSLNSWPALLALLGTASLWAGRRWWPADQCESRLLRLATGLTVLLFIRLISWLELTGTAAPWAALLWWPPLDYIIALLIIGQSGVLVTAFRISQQRLTFIRGIADRTWAVAAAIFVIFTLIYGGYTLYYCQMTMIHGDEGHYLRVTQSLIDDGDIDLANNLTPGYTREFHVAGFGVHKASSSPAGKVFSSHPAGLSVLLVPAYAAAKVWWANPRLGAALFMALISAGLVTSIYVLLNRVGFARLPSLTATLIVGSTVPVGTYSAQLYPDTPAAFAITVTLCAVAHWLVPGRPRVNWGRAEPVVLGGLSLLLAFLPFLHPRLIFPATGLGLLLIAQAHTGQRRRQNFAVLLSCAAAGAAAILAHNYHVSDDWLGHFRPGSAMPEGAVDIFAVPMSAARHWLTAGTGLGNSSPIYFFALIGVGLLLWSRDRRGLAAIGIWLTTGAVNCLVPYEMRGYTFAGRLMLTSIPALAIGLAAVLHRGRSQFFILLLVAASILLSWESIATLMPLPESGYHGDYLALRSINMIYPWETHFLLRGERPGVGDVLFWASLLAGVLLLLRCTHWSVRRRTGILAILAMIPFLWGQTEASKHRQDQYAVHRGLNREGHPVQVQDLDFDVRKVLHNADRVQGLSAYADRVRASSSERGPGFLTYYHGPPLLPGTARVHLAALKVSPEAEAPVGALYAARRATLLAASPWATQYRRLLVDPLAQSATMAIPITGFRMGTFGLEYSGRGSVEAGAPLLVTQESMALAYDEQDVIVVDVESGSEDPGIFTGSSAALVTPGHYRAIFDIEGSSWSSMFFRDARSVSMAVFTADADGDEVFNTSMRTWFDLDREGVRSTYLYPHFNPPMAERTSPAWAAGIPFRSDEVYSLPFILEKPSILSMLLKYDGESGLRLRRIRLVKLTPRQ